MQAYKAQKFQWLNFREEAMIAQNFCGFCYVQYFANVTFVIDIIFLICELCNQHLVVSYFTVSMMSGLGNHVIHIYE